MRKGLKESLFLHVAVILVVIFGLPHFPRDEYLVAAPIAVEVVSPDQVSSAPPRQHTPQAQPTPPKPPEPTPPPPPPPTPPPPPPPEPDDVPSPEPPKPVQPEPPKPQEQAQVTPPKPPRARPPVPAAQRTPPRPEPERPRPQNNQFANLLNDLSKEPDNQPAQEGSPDSPVEQPANISSVLNAGELDAVRNQVMGCWLEPMGLREGERMVVEVKVEVNPDRTVKSAVVVDKARMGTDPFYRTLAESAVRAMYHSQCGTLKLPPDKYSTWRTITFRFSPEGII